MLMRARHIKRDSGREARRIWELERAGGGGPRQRREGEPRRDLRGAQGVAFALVVSGAIWAAAVEAAWRWLY